MHSLLFHLANPIGMVGVILTLIAYYFLSVGAWRAHSFRYQFLNFLGAVLILYSLLFHWNLSSVIIEIAWIVISSIGILRCYTAPNRPDY